MTKTYHKRRSQKGGLLGLETLGQTFSNLGNTITSSATDFWDKTKKATGMSSSSSTSTYTPTTTSTTPTYTPTYGGKRYKRKSKKHLKSKTMKKGGSTLTLSDRVNQPIDSLVSRVNQPINSLAANAAPYTGVTASSSLVGGRRRSRKTRKARRSRKSTR